MITRIFLVFVFFVSSLCQGREFVRLQNLSGTTIEAQVLAFQNGRVQLKRKDGVAFVVSISIFNEASKALIMQSMEDKQRSSESGSGSRLSSSASKVSFKRLNEAVGQSLFEDNRLWDDTADEVGERLRWPVESSTSNSISCRLYADSSYRFLNARPYSAAFYGSPGEVSRFSLVFANKGDCFASAGVAEEHFRDGSVTRDPEELAAMIERDAETIAERLEGILGTPRRQNYGEGSAKRKVSRWDWNEHSFLLSVAEGEFVSLAIEHSEVADRRGKQDKVADMHIRRIHEANVERRDNGDVVIRNIPMVDQGPKGYCVPATFERCMRYMEIPADMYLLAMSGSTGLGGGTVVSVLVNSVQKEVWGAGRTFKTLQAQPNFRDLQKLLDEGVPVLWGMHSTEWFNDTADRRTALRRSTDAESWKKIVEKAADKVADLPKPHRSENLHICIIHGFNKETEEIAFTDSWGPRFVERWIGVAEAEHFSHGMCWLIEY